MLDIQSRIHRVARYGWATFLVHTGCVGWAKRQLRRKDALIILTLHRVIPNSDYNSSSSPRGMKMKEKTFSGLLEHLKSNYAVVDLLSPERAGASKQRLRVVLTFDDGWKDTYCTAFPHIRQFGFPMIVFVCPQLMGLLAPFWPERLTARLRRKYPRIENCHIDRFIEAMKQETNEARVSRLEKLACEVTMAGEDSCDQPVDSTMSWDNVREMSACGVQVGSHTLTHEILTTIPVDEASDQIAKSKSEIERQLGKPCEVFSYPNGSWSPALRQLVSQTGFKLALATESAAATAEDNPFSVPRMNVSEDNVAGLTGRFSATMFEYVIVWRAWRAMRSRRKKQNFTRSLHELVTSKSSAPQDCRNRLT